MLSGEALCCVGGAMIVLINTKRKRNEGAANNPRENGPPQPAPKVVKKNLI